MNSQLTDLQDRCNGLLLHLLGSGSSEFHPHAAPLLYRLFEASAYSLTAGGKRVRPLLVYAAGTAVKEECLSAQGIDYAACAAEMIHTYSLVHDDLPAMDDDELRRGQPTCHIAFDEATAMLVGDALQARAFELLAEAPDVPAETRVLLVQCLGAAVGARGMAGGQAIDVAASDREISLEHLEVMHTLKTGALIQASVQMGALVAGASSEQCEALDEFANAIGLAFQVRDDVLDVESDSATLGKQQGTDAAHNKPTYVSLLGADGAKAKLAELLDDALAALQPFGESASSLREIAHYIAERDH
ncbi:MAG: polyprenyl synthetase family protein [Gammaproteobacteria bacterium]|nr:polyprenyl synthetase family protein [Gammaproteobacteria bacterium]